MNGPDGKPTKPDDDFESAIALAAMAVAHGRIQDQPGTAPADIDRRDTWPANAPADLIYLHDRIGKRNERAVLCRLLKAPTMSRAWRELNKRVNSGDMPSREAYKRLWGAIYYSLLQANRNSCPQERGEPSHENEMRKYGQKIAKDASQLANALRDGPFDLCAHEFFPSEVVELARKSVHCLSLEWTTLPDLLDELARKARAHADRPRVVGKWSPEFRSNYFIRALAPHFLHYFGGPMEATLAAIATVVLNRDDSRALTDQDVKRALRHERG
jgi:hypothetical protein